MENIHRGEEPGHFTIVCNLSEQSIALLEEEIKYIRAKLIIKSRQQKKENEYPKSEYENPNSSKFVG